MISVIIPNWNGARFMPGVLNSLAAQTYPRVEVIVVDNASADDSVALIEREYPWVRQVLLDENRGLTGGVNAGIAATRGEIIALLNNDAEADPAWLEELALALDNYPEAGAVASKMLLYDKRDVLNSAGDFYTVAGEPGNRGVWERDEGQYDDAAYVFSGCGGAVAYRRAMLDRIGLFDESLFMYCEDVDLGWRAQLAGYKTVYTPRARIYHRLSATGGGVIASYYCGRNFVHVLVKDVPGFVWRRHWPRILGAQLRHAWESVRHLGEPAARARLRGQLAALARIPRWLRQRRVVQATRTVSDEYIESILV
ncbi:MAG: glycosyltransferase family 2 protein [Chloroflexi bacterium]|nr:glycosyltransferase family 2 protein [Chloroflexota bacterium]MBU1747280.1 glycosyltransferase family 2 protein [Chloroflexota bacterium]